MNECLICLDKLENNLVVLSCGHIYHYNCIQEWMNKKKIPNRICTICETDNEIVNIVNEINLNNINININKNNESNILNNDVPLLNLERNDLINNNSNANRNNTNRNNTNRNNYRENEELEYICCNIL